MFLLPANTPASLHCTVCATVMHQHYKHLHCKPGPSKCMVAGLSTESADRALIVCAHPTIWHLPLLLQAFLSGTLRLQDFVVCILDESNKAMSQKQQTSHFSMTQMSDMMSVYTSSSSKLVRYVCVSSSTHHTMQLSPRVYDVLPQRRCTQGGLSPLSHGLRGQRGGQLKRQDAGVNFQTGLEESKCTSESENVMFCLLHCAT